jgi:hypothetical protein
MSVWPSASETSTPALCGSEGDLVSISVSVEPRDLEDLLEALATLDFPINPQIYHDGAVVYVDRDGRQRPEPSTIVEFPAYARRVSKIRGVLETCGFASGTFSVSPMLDEIHSAERVEPAPPGASYAFRLLRKRATAVRAGAHCVG